MNILEAVSTSAADHCFQLFIDYYEYNVNLRWLNYAIGDIGDTDSPFSDFQFQNQSIMTDASYADVNTGKVLDSTTKFCSSQFNAFTAYWSLGPLPQWKQFKTG